MAKKELAPMTFLFPMPAVLVGANVAGKPNFLAVAYCGIVNLKPAMISVALGKAHYTNPGIRRNNTFSVNVPSVDMARETDFCGMYSGHKQDKSKVFETFYGKLETAPMITRAPVNLECRVVQTIELAVDEVIIGEIMAVYADEECMSGGLPDIQKIKPLVFSISDRKYYTVGSEVGKAWSMGRDFKPGG